MIGRHPKLRFQCFLASRHANQSMCTLVRELPNLSLAGLLVAQLLSRHDRPGHARAARNGAGQQAGRVLFRCLLRRMVVCQGVHGAKILARVLAERIELGQFDIQDALEFARATFYESPQSLLGIVPRR